MPKYCETSFDPSFTDTLRAKFCFNMRSVLFWLSFSIDLSFLARRKI